MTCDAYSSDGLSQMDNFIDGIESQNPSLDILGVVVTKYRASRRVDREIVSALREAWGDKVFETQIRETDDIVKAPLFKKDIASYDINSRGACDYNSLMLEIESKL